MFNIRNVDNMKTNIVVKLRILQSQMSKLNHQKLYCYKNSQTYQISSKVFITTSPPNYAFAVVFKLNLKFFQLMFFFLLFSICRYIVSITVHSLSKNKRSRKNAKNVELAWRICSWEKRRKGKSKKFYATNFY